MTSPIHDAVKSGTCASVDGLLEQEGVDVNAYFCGMTPLQLAAERNNCAMIDLLILKGARVNELSDCVFPNDGTALHSAAKLGHVEAVALLLSKGADVHAQVPEYCLLGGCTPLHLAAHRGSEAVTELLVENGAHVSARNKQLYSWTPLHFAASQGHVAVIQVLIAKGADPHDLNGGRSEIPLHLAATAGHVDAIDKLVSLGSWIDTKALNGYTALHFSSEKGHAAAVAMLVNKGANVEAVDNTGHTPLHLAARYNKPDVIDVLCKRGADLYHRHKFGNTPIHEAALEGHLAALKALLSHGADVHTLSQSPLSLTPLRSKIIYRTALHIASSRGHTEVVKFLISCGADINSALPTKTTPLHTAIEQNAIVKVLLDEGADVGVKDERGLTALQDALRLEKSIPACRESAKMLKRCEESRQKAQKIFPAVASTRKFGDTCCCS